MNSLSEDPQHRTDGTEPRQGDPAGPSPRPPLRRPVNGRVLAGVAAGLGEHFNVDVTIVRVAFAVLTVLGFTSLAYFVFIPLYLGGIPLYLACWLLVPEEGDDHSIIGRLLASRQHRPD